MKEKGKVSLIITYIIVFAIIAIVTVAGVYYLFFAFKDNEPVIDNSSGSYTINDALINRLLKEVSIIDPSLREGKVVLASDLTDDEKLYIVIQDIIETGTIQVPENATEENSITISLDTILENAQRVWNTTTYDYYPDEIKFQNYYFRKQGDYYLGNKTMEDDEFGAYRFTTTQFSGNGSEIYFTTGYYYYYDNKGAYTDASRTAGVCEGKGCADVIDMSEEEREKLTFHELHITYKINHGNFIFVAADVK